MTADLARFVGMQIADVDVTVDGYVVIALRPLGRRSRRHLMLTGTATELADGCQILREIAAAKNARGAA